MNIKEASFPQNQRVGKMKNLHFSSPKYKIGKKALFSFERSEGGGGGERKEGKYEGNFRQPFVSRILSFHIFCPCFLANSIPLECNE